MPELSTLGSVIKTAYEAEDNAFTDTKNTKLAGIETSATADQTGAEIKSAYEGEANTNAFTDNEKTKLTGIETSATADQTGAEIKTAYEAEDDTNAFTDDEKTKLADIHDAVEDWLSDANPGALTDVLQNLSSATGVLVATNVATTSDTPIAQTWRRYTTAGGVLVVFDTSWSDDGEGVIQKITGAGDIVLVADTGVTINGASSIGDSTEVTDAVWENSSGANTEITSAGANLPDLDVGDYFQVPSHSGEADNEGWYIATGTPSTSSLPATKLIGENPIDASSVTVDIDEPVRNAAGVYHLLESIAAVKRIGSDFLIQGGTNADKDLDGSNLTNFGRPVGLVEVITGHIVTAEDKNYFLDQFAGYPYDIVSLTIRSQTGTCTAGIDIDGTPVTGISAVSVSSSEATGTASAANSVTAGQTVHLEISSNSAAVDVRFTLVIERT